MPVTDVATGSKTSTWVRLLPLLVFLFAVLIRLPGLGWGLKNDLHHHSYHPDEPVIWLYSQRIEPTSFDFTPGFYNYGTLYLTGLKVVSDMTAAYTGAPDPKSPESTWAFVSRVHFAARLLTAICGAATALALFLMLRRRIGEFGAVAAALLLAVSPAHVVHSRFQTVDVLATLFLAVGTLFSLRIFDREREEGATRDVLLAGAFIGLSAGTKYTGILALLSLYVVLFGLKRPKAFIEAAMGTGAALAVFVLVTPGIFLETDAFMRDFRYEMLHTSTGHGLVFTGTGSGFAYHFGNLLYGVGGLLTMLGLIGLTYAAIRKEWWVFALLAFFIPYFLLIGRAEVKFMRYTFPLLIGLAAGFGALMAEANRRGGGWRGVVVAGILALGGVDSRGLIGAVNATAAMTREDGRDTAVREIRKGEVAEVGLPEDPWFWSPPFFPNSTAPLAMGLEARLRAMSENAQPPVVLWMNEGSVGVFDSRLVTETRPELIVMCALEVDPRERLVGRNDIPADAQVAAKQYRDFMQALGQNYTLERRFGSQNRLVEDMMYVDPLVLVWRRNEPTP
jgi:4-amino-4-deoxy-L-arabinose transferase-like glycosyltransferase